MTATAGTLTRTATLVVVGSAAQLAEAADIVRGGEHAGALRVVLISTTSEAAPEVQADPDLVAIDGLRPEYVDNAIAGVRLSSLPTVVWWRGGRPEAVEAVASLSDRVILDADDPWPLWQRIGSLVEHTAFTDLRWARLTRWRAAMAHFFDLPQVQQAAPSLSRLTIAGTDHARCALFAGWLDASLEWKGRVTPTFTGGETGAPLESVTLDGAGARLVLKLLPNRSCLDTSAEIATRVLASRVVSAGDERLSLLLSEEMRVRSRDLAFERALQSALSLRALPSA